MYKIICFAIFCILSVNLSVFSSSQEVAFKYNEAGLEKLKNNDYKGAIEDFKAAHSYFPSDGRISKNLAAAYNNYGFFLMGQGQLRKAIEQFQAAFYYDRDNKYALYNLGQAYYKLQDIDRSREYLEKAYEKDSNLKGLKGLLKKVRRESLVEDEFETTETAHFIIAASGDVAIDKFSYIKVYLEEAYGRVGRLLSCYPESKTGVILYSEEDYRNLLEGRPPWTMGIFDGKIRIPLHKYKYTNEDVIRIIYHEYAHVLVFDITGGNCPRWLSEGIASKAEDLAGRKDEDMIRRYLVEFELIPLDKLPRDFSKVDDAETATWIYIESYLLVDYIFARQGPEGMKKILESHGAGRSIGQALADTFGESLKQFEKNWQNYISAEFNLDG